MAAATLTTVGIATAALALLLVVLAARLVLAGRRREAALHRSRGASPRQLVVMQTGESLAVLLPAGLAGWAVASVLVPTSGGAAQSASAAAAVATTAIGVFVAGAGMEARRPLPALWREPSGGSHGRSAPTGLEVLVIVLALVAAVTLRHRGLDGASRDPVSAGAPVLVALAGAVVAARCWQPPWRWLTRRVRRRAGLGSVLGLVRSGRDPALRAATLGMAFATALAVFATSMQASLDTARQAVAWDQAGVPVLVTPPSGGSLDPRVATVLPSEADVVASHRLRTTVRQDGRSRHADVLLTDPQALSDLVADLPVRFEPPAGVLVDAAHHDVGAPVPAVVSTAGLVREPASPGDRLEVLIGSRYLEVEVVAVRDRVPAVSTDPPPWLLVSAAAVEHALGTAPAPTELAVRPAPGTEGEVVAALRSTDLHLEVRSRAELLERLRGQPLGQGVSLGFQVLAWVAAGVVPLVLAAVVILTGRARSRDLALLAALGTPRRERRTNVLIELLPAVFVAVVAGVVLGAGAVRLVAGVLDLSSFADGVPVRLAVAIPPAVPLVGVAVALASLVTVAAAFWARRLAPVAMLRKDLRA